jgi:hypothetical protein
MTRLEIAHAGAVVRSAEFAALHSRNRRRPRAPKRAFWLRNSFVLLFRAPFSVLVDLTPARRFELRETPDGERTHRHWMPVGIPGAVHPTDRRWSVTRCACHHPVIPVESSYGERAVLEFKLETLPQADLVPWR